MAKASRSRRSSPVAVVPVSRGPSELLAREIRVFLRLCEATPSARAQTCWMLAKAGEWDQYLDLQPPDPDSSTFDSDLLLTECMRKNPLIPTSHNPEAKALETWKQAEGACRATNEFLRLRSSGLVNFDKSTDAVFTTARGIIASVLGPLDSSSLGFVLDHSRFGPGATSAVRGRDVLLSRKMVCREWHTTPGLCLIMKSHPLVLASGGSVSIRAYNEVCFVPKTAKTHRAIAIEPHGAIFMQLGIGALIRERLRRVGIDLNSQADRNRALAAVAQYVGLSTIDLSSASDTIAYLLVMELLPIEWFVLLDAARCSHSQLPDGTTVALEKFSSMGNGYTFELETLLFWALAKACSSDGDELAVFGDDIIVRRENAPLLIRTLSLLGFKVNERKTFLAGRFFESCGTDWWDGRNVRPFYFKGVYHDQTHQAIRICNKIRRYSSRAHQGLSCDRRYLRAWLESYRLDRLARSTSCGLNRGDEAIIRNLDEACPARARHGHEGWQERVWVSAPKKSTETSEDGAYLATLYYGVPYEALGFGLPAYPLIARSHEYTRGAVQRGQLRVRVSVNWHEPGPWV